MYHSSTFKWLMGSHLSHWHVRGWGVATKLCLWPSWHFYEGDQVSTSHGEGIVQDERPPCTLSWAIRDRQISITFSTSIAFPKFSQSSSSHSSHVSTQAGRHIWLLFRWVMYLYWIPDILRQLKQWFSHVQWYFWPPTKSTFPVLLELNLSDGPEETRSLGSVIY